MSIDPHRRQGRLGCLLLNLNHRRRPPNLNPCLNHQIQLSTGAILFPVLGSPWFLTPSPRAVSILEMRLAKEPWIFPAPTRRGHIEPSTLQGQHAKACPMSVRKSPGGGGRAMGSRPDCRQDEELQ